MITMSAGLVHGQAALLVLIFGDKVASENFYFSLKAGANFSTIHGLEGGEYRWGPNFGLVNNIRINDRFYLMPEFLPLSTRGIKEIPVENTNIPGLDELLEQPESMDRTLSYIDIPILLRANLGERLSVSAGPQISILTGNLAFLS